MHVFHTIFLHGMGGKLFTGKKWVLVCSITKNYLGRKNDIYSERKQIIVIFSSIFYVFNFTGFSSYNIIMFDVDSKDSSLGMSSPPRPFVTPEFLATVKQILHHSQGELLNH